MLLHMIDSRKSLRRLVRFNLALGAMLMLGACASKQKGIPRNLPSISLASSSATPPHTMASYEYPFDSGGNYVSAWAAEGERRAGRSRMATQDDSERWSRSHGSSSSARKKVVVSTKKSPAKSTSGKGRTYVVKKGDTLYGIALRYGTTVARIKSANGLRSDLLRIGMSLRIPS